MSDVAIADGAPAPADAPASPAAVIDTQQVAPPNPVHSEPLPAPKAEPAEKPSSTVADAIERASRKVEAQQRQEPAKAEAKPAEKVEAKAEAPAERQPAQRDETGRFAPREPAQHDAAAPPMQQPTQQQPRQPVRDLPARFSSDPQASADWETTPESVRHATNRSIRELETGIQKYKADAEEFDRVRNFAEAARRNGGDLHSALSRVVEIEQAFQRNPVEGFQKIADHFGISLRQVAAHVMGQPQDQVAAQNDSVIRELRNEVAQLQRQIGGVTQTIQQQQERTVQSSVAQFAAANPRFEELSNDIAFFLKSGRTSDLAEAYRLAEMLNPGPAPVPAQRAASDAAPPSAEAQTLKGMKSVSGAPSPGSDPAPRRKAANSPIEALDRAFATVGLR